MVRIERELIKTLDLANFPRLHFLVVTLSWTLNEECGVKV